MGINSVGNASINFQTQTAMSTPEAAEVQKAGSDNDGNSDDGAAKAAQAAAASTVNLNGQKIGQLINVSA
jgi:hypothetical protein